MSVPAYHRLLCGHANLDAASSQLLVNDVQQRMYEYAGAPFRNAVELLRRGLPARGAESPLKATIVPRYNTETGEAAPTIRQPLEGQVGRDGPASIVPSWSTTPASIAPAPEVSPMSIQGVPLDKPTTGLIPIESAWPMILASRAGAAAAA